MQRKAIAALMISLLLLSACGHGAGEQTFEAFRDTLTGKLVTVTAQVRVQRGDTVTDYTLTCQELPDGYDLTVTAPEQAAGVTAHLRDGASALAFCVQGRRPPRVRRRTGPRHHRAGHDR